MLLYMVTEYIYTYIIVLTYTRANASFFRAEMLSSSTIVYSIGLWNIYIVITGIPDNQYQKGHISIWNFWCSRFDANRRFLHVYTRGIYTCICSTAYYNGDGCSAVMRWQQTLQRLATVTWMYHFVSVQYNYSASCRTAAVSVLRAILYVHAWCMYMYMYTCTAIIIQSQRVDFLTYWCTTWSCMVLYSIYCKSRIIVTCSPECF